MAESAKKKPRLPKAEEETIFDPAPIVLSSEDEADDDLSLTIVENGNPSSSSSPLKKRKKKAKERKMGAQDNAVHFYNGDLTIKQKIKIVDEISTKLRESPDGRLDMFRATCFGPWLDIRSKFGDGTLVHTILQTRIDSDDIPSGELRFHIGGHHLRFGPDDFCLVTGLRFGPIPELPEQCGVPFRERMFPNMTSRNSVKVKDIRALFDDEGFSLLSAHDAVRICLLLLLEVGFLGRQPYLVVSDHILVLVENLAAWDRYPWGTYVWGPTLVQLQKKLPVPPRLDAIPPKYTLLGFIYAFKIWIFETFPVSRTYYERQDGVVPRAIAWKRINGITWNKSMSFIRPGVAWRGLVPTAQEQATDWWLDSCRFFSGHDDRFQPPPPPPRHLSPLPHSAPPFSSGPHSSRSSPQPLGRTLPQPSSSCRREAYVDRSIDFERRFESIEAVQREIRSEVTEIRSEVSGLKAFQQDSRQAIMDRLASMEDLFLRTVESIRCHGQADSDVVEIQHSPADPLPPSTSATNIVQQCRTLTACKNRLVIGIEERKKRIEERKKEIEERQKWITTSNKWINEANEVCENLMSQLNWGEELIQCQTSCIEVEKQMHQDK